MGAVEFWRDIQRLLKNNITWNGIDPLFKVGTNNDYEALGVVFLVTSLISYAVGLAAVGKPSFTIEFAVEFAVRFAVGLAVGLAVMAGFAVAFTGLRFWYTARLNSDYKRYFAIFSYPFFCAFPIVLIYSSLGLHNFFPWQTVVFIWFTIITVCTLLWQRGQMLDRAAQNPFQKILEGYYDGPIRLAPLGRGNWK